jgi:putative membrane protein
MVLRFVIRALFAALGLWLAERFFHAVSAKDVETLFVAAVLLGLVNAFIRPLVFILTLPLTLVTLGLFLLIVNAGMVLLVGLFLPGFVVHGLVGGVVAAIVTGVTSWIGHAVIRDADGYRRRD